MTFTEEEQGFLAQFAFSFEAGIGDLRKELRGLRQDMRRARLEVPRDRRENFSPLNTPNSQYPASGNMILEVDGPQMGMLWEVRQIIVAGPVITAAPAGTAYVFAQSTPPYDLSTAMCRDISLTPFPVKGFYSTGVFKVRPQANLYLVITGGTAGTSYVAYADVQEYPDTPLMATVNAE